MRPPLFSVIGNLPTSLIGLTCPDRYSWPIPVRTTKKNNRQLDQGQLSIRWTCTPCPAPLRPQDGNQEMFLKWTIEL